MYPPGTPGYPAPGFASPGYPAGYPEAGFPPGTGPSGQARADGAGWSAAEGPWPQGGHRPGAELGAAVRDATASWRGTLRRARRGEGPRGVALRYSVGMRYVGYLVVTIVCAAVANASFAGTPWRMAGTLILFAAAAMTATAALGTLFIPYKRPEIVEDYRHFLFQVSMLPATGIAVFQWVLKAYSADPQNQDNFLGLLHNALPLLFAFTVFVPAIVFVKAVAGRRMLDRSQQDDQELMETWTRQDRLMP